jgi:hypothetical protein
VLGWEGVFCKKTKIREGVIGGYLQMSHLSVWPLDLDLVDMIGVCIVSTGRLVSLRATPPD